MERETPLREHTQFLVQKQGVDDFPAPLTQCFAPLRCETGIRGRKFGMIGARLFQASLWLLRRFDTGGEVKSSSYTAGFITLLKGEVRV